MVDAIEDGRLVRVTESYAKREGLFVLKRPNVNVTQKAPAGLTYQDKMNIEHGTRRKSVLDLDRFRKPLKHDKNALYTDLKENFHWDIVKARKIRDLTRKQLANAVGATDEEIKLIENGVLSSGNYVLLNKIEKFFNIQLRRGSVNYQESMRQVVNAPASEREMKREVREEKKEEKVEKREESKGIFNPFRRRDEKKEEKAERGDNSDNKPTEGDGDIDNLLGGDIDVKD